MTVFFLFLAAYSIFFWCDWLLPKKKAIWLLLILVVLFLVPPFASRDTASYMVIARNAIYLHQNPYHSPIGNPLNPWVGELGKIWWLNDPSPYGPIFLLISFLPVSARLSSLITTIFLYKLLVLLAYLGTIYFFRKLIDLYGKKKSLVYLYAFNPAILFHLVAEGHNEAFVLLFLLAGCYLSERKRLFKSVFFFFLSVFVKFSTLIFLPLFWFKGKRVSAKKVFITLVIFSTFILIFTRIFGIKLSQMKENLSFISYNCIYACTLPIQVTDLLFGDHRWLARLVVFTSTYFAIFYLFLLKQQEPLKFIFWSTVALLFLYITWLTPWYLVMVIPFGLLIEEKRYRQLTFILTVYSLFHYFGF